MTAFTALLDRTRTGFTAPSFAIFTDLLNGWVLAPGRRTITAMIAVADPTNRRADDAYHRFVRDGRWSMPGLWQILAVPAVRALCPTAVVSVDLDDTLFHKTGRKIEGAGVFRDAVRSTARRVVYATGLNLVVVTLRVNPPWGGMPIGLPINARLHRKHDPITTVAHAAAMVRELADRLPDKTFQVCADGAYSSLAGAGLPRTHYTGRMRRDAALFEAAPPRTGKRGRPRLPGARLPTPPELAAALRNKDWQTVTLDVRGTTHTRPVHSRDVLWFGVCRTALVRLVIVRDPNGVEPDDFFFSTDLTATGAATASRYAGRWSIQVTFRDTKQDLSGQNPQSFKRQGPERAPCLALWLHGLTWCWYLQEHPQGGTWIVRPWYPRKATPSFLDALAALRRSLWYNELQPCQPPKPDRTTRPKLPKPCSTRSPTRPDTAKVHWCLPEYSCGAFFQDQQGVRVPSTSVTRPASAWAGGGT